ncbi:MAG: efflux RND transporter periplasmic adaptor subunit [Steroidobacter sp.]
MMQTPEPTADAFAATPRGASVIRRRLLVLLTVIFGACIAGYFVYQRVHGGFFESTQDAYVSGNLVQLTPQVSGAVLTIYADDTDLVHAGQPLVKLDAADRDIALEQAEAELAKAVRGVRVVFASRGQLSAELAVRQAELARAQSDVQRREGLTARGLVPREELDHARDVVSSAQASLQAARESLTAMHARIDGTTVENHPDVAHAAARVKDAWLAVQRTTVHAPVTGYIAKRSVQVGQRVEPGVAMMAIVPLADVWVDANFKEVQLRRMRIGQAVQLFADIYGKRVEYEGRIAGVGMGTGAAFALLPAQNASGNWIKVVQRVPVRIRLRPEQLVEHPLRIGLSMRVRVDLREDGLQLAQTPRQGPVYATHIYSNDSSAADRRIREIVAANSGLAVGRPGAPDDDASVASINTR